MLKHPVLLLNLYDPITLIENGIETLQKGFFLRRCLWMSFFSFRCVCVLTSLVCSTALTESDHWPAPLGCTPLEGHAQLHTFQYIIDVIQAVHEYVDPSGKRHATVSVLDLQVT